MKATHVVPHINQEASGPSYSVPRLCQSLAERGNEVSLKCLAAQQPIPGVTLEVHRQWPFLTQFAVSTDLANALRRESRHVDIIHNHSLWSMTNVAAGCVVPGKRAKLVTAPRGTLSPWALQRRRTLKRLLKPLQWRALERADLLHATSDAELKEIRDLGLKAPVAVIPNGIDIPRLVERSRPENQRTLLFLSRIHPKKGLDRLLQAWQSIQQDHVDWQLVIAGRGEEEHVRHVQELAARLKLRDVDFPGPLYGADKAQTYRNADLFVLPTHSENFGLVVGEALSHECPVVVTHGAPWSGVVTNQCGWWVDNRIDSLAATLSEAMSEPRHVLTDMGARGRSWIANSFSWDVIAEQLEQAYRWVLGDGDRPAQIKDW